MKNNNIKFIKYYLIFTYALVLSNCNSDTDKNTILLKSIIDDIIGQDLIVPNNLQRYNPFLNDFTSNSEVSKSKLKIYSLIDASCNTCINSINKWSVLIPELQKNNVSLILVFKSDDGFELLKYLCESGKIESFPYPFFLDINNDFVKFNKFMKIQKHFETVLTNKDNIILLLGNPLFNKNIKDLYFNKINSFDNP